MEFLGDKMTKFSGWLTLLALIVFPHVVWAEDAKENPDQFALIEFFETPPVVAQNWPAVPAEFRKLHQLPEDVALGLFLCAEKPPASCKRTLLPLSEIVSIARDRNIANVNLTGARSGWAWVVVDKNGKSYRAESPPTPLVIFRGDPAKVQWDVYYRAQVKGSDIVPYFFKEKGIGASPVMPVYSANSDKDTVSYQLLSLTFLKGLKLVSRNEAEEVIEKNAENERARINEHNRHVEQYRLDLEERAKMNEALRKESEARATSFRKALRPGGQSHCGMIIEVKKPIVQIQTMIGPFWLKVDQIYPPGEHRCLFENGVYKE